MNFNAWGDLEPSYACVNFIPRLNSVIDGKQHLSEVVFSALVGFSLKGKLRDDLVSGSYPCTQNMLDSTNSDADCMNTIITGDESWVSLQWKSHESTKHYLTQMLLVINWSYWQAEKFPHAYEGSRSPYAKNTSLKCTRFSQKINNVRHLPNSVLLSLS